MVWSECWKQNPTAEVSPPSGKHSLFLSNTRHSEQVAFCLNWEQTLVGLRWISFFFNKIIYLFIFIFACVGSLLLHTGFL